MTGQDDEIIAEIRRYREEHAAAFGYDVRAMGRDVMERQRRSGRPLVQPPPRRAATPGGREPLIVTDPKVMLGKPVVAGTRITVQLVLEHLGHGETVEQLLEAYPHLTRDGILAALRYAAAQQGP